MRPTARCFGLLFLAAAAAGTAAGTGRDQLWALSASALIAPALGAAILALDTRRTSHELSFVTDRVQSPSPTHSKWEARCPRSVCVADVEVSCSDGGVRAFRLSPSARTRTRTLQFANTRRGYLTVGPVTETTWDPFGCVRRTVVKPVLARTLIWPRTEDLQLDMARGGPHPAQAARKVGTGTDLHSLREYEDGDDVRYIDHLASARHEVPLVKRHWHQERETVVVVADARAGSDQLDFLAQASASILASFSNSGHPTTLVVTDGTKVDCQPGSTTLSDAMDVLALMETSPGDLAETIRHVHQLGRIFVVTADATAVGEDPTATYVTLGSGPATENQISWVPLVPFSTAWTTYMDSIA